MTPGASDALTADAARFAADLARLHPQGGTVLLAVSGGPDSMAMLTLAAAARPGRIVAATVDHRLRADSAREAAAVASWCARIGVPHRTLAPPAPPAGASVQAAARSIRYPLLTAAMTGAGAEAILTAHHADDQAETFLMRAARGSGLAGLAGVRPVATIAQARVVRPLLDWRRAELRAIVRREGVAFVDDPSNADPAHDRTRFRALLAGHEWLDPPRIARAAAALAEADAEWRAAVDWLWELRAHRDGASVAIDVAALPRELRRRLLRRGIGIVRAAAAITRPVWSDAVNVEPLLDALSAGRRATQAGVIVTPNGERWRLRPAPPRKTG